MASFLSDGHAKKFLEDCFGQSKLWVLCGGDKDRRGHALHGQLVLETVTKGQQVVSAALDFFVVWVMARVLF